MAAAPASRQACSATAKSSAGAAAERARARRARDAAPRARCQRARAYVSALGRRLDRDDVGRRAQDQGSTHRLPRSMDITWTTAGEYTDIRYELSGDGIAKITIDRPEVRNAFRPETIIEISRRARARARGPAGRRDHPHRRGAGRVLLGRRPARARRHRLRGRRARAVGRFHVTDLHVQMRRLPKPIVAMVAGYAIGGGHVLHLVCDLTIAADNARFGQVGPRVGSFDGGFGASLLARLVGPKKAKEIWFLCRQYDAAGGARHGPRQHRRAARATSRRRPSPGAARCSRCRRSRCGC